MKIADFENKWFPRTRRIIERFAPATHRDGLLDAFFRDLQQQPLGPLVVGSVSTFLDRVDALAKSDAPGAAKVRSVLADRGLDATPVARLRQTLDEARSIKNAPATPVLDPAIALRARRDAYDSLWLWWRDWRETFHSEVDGRLRRELGLVDTSIDRYDEVDDCQLKALALDARQRAAWKALPVGERGPTPSRPRLWILSAGDPEASRRSWAMEPMPDWPTGCYWTGCALGPHVVVIRLLPRTGDTLLLRLLGTGETLRAAYDDLRGLPDDAWERGMLAPVFTLLRLDMPRMGIGEYDPKRTRCDTRKPSRSISGTARSTRPRLARMA